MKTNSRTLSAFLCGMAMVLSVSAQPSAQIPERQANYFPEGNAFSCVNGTNRYTRALYGSYDEYRIETSDRPIFAVYKKNNCRNLRFRVTYGGHTFQLDSADYCKARYIDGRRDYLLRDKRWGNGELRMTVIAWPDREGGVWKISADCFDGRVEVEALLCETRVSKFKRNGDMGNFETPGCFEPKEQPQHLATAKVSMGSEAYFSLEDLRLEAAADRQARQWAQRYDAADRHYRELASTVAFRTPDPYLNPLGGAMVMAADGAWSGKVWLHGAVGWRVPLSGWRGAYAGDFLGMFDRQNEHFTAYAKSMVKDIPVTQGHLMDESNNLARGAYRWGTPMYSNGYICRNPERNDQFHHYDMNLVYIDELLWHLQFDADTALLRKVWPVLVRHLAWEKRAWDPDGDSLYDAYCCIWASDALQYNSGAVTHSSAYNYRANLLAARIAEIIGMNPEPYRREAEAILKAMNARLWLPQEGHWAEYQDFMGLKRVHKNAAVWSIYTPIDCESCTPEQAYRATRYIDRHIPRIPFAFDGHTYHTISTSNWAPYEWSLNNVAMAEVMHTILAYYQAGRPEAAYRLLKANVLDFMYLGHSPANFGQLSTFDRSMGESYRDFTDVTGISTRTLIEGLYGITPDALDGRCIIRPGFPADWDSASVHTPYLDYTFRRVNGREVYDIRQKFQRPLTIVIRQNMAGGRYKDTAFSRGTVQHIELEGTGYREEPMEAPETVRPAMGTAFDDVRPERCRTVDLTKHFNAKVTDIFRNQYLTPRSPYTTLCVPTQGIGDWCSTKRTADIDDTKFRSMISHGLFHAPLDGQTLAFATPAEGRNIIYTSLWDNYPDSVTVALKGKASHAYLMMAGSTNAMQVDIANAVVTVEYADGTSDRLELSNPSNWCPIEQDFLRDAVAFPMPQPRPYRVGLATGLVSRRLPGEEKKAVISIPGGAAQLLDIPLNPDKKLRQLTLRALSTEVVVGLMSVTLQQ